MLAFLKAVGEAIAAQGARGLAGLAGLVPLGDKVYDISADVINRYRKGPGEESLHHDAQAMLEANPEDVKDSAKRIAQEVAAGQSDEIVNLVEAYLTQLPAVARQVMKRPGDQAGRTIPPTLDILDPLQLAALLPRRPTRFRTDDAVPHAPQWRFVEQLGAGGFGEVWLARHSFLDQRRAFKFCLDPVSRERLLRHEGEVVKRVMLASAHPKDDESGIVPLLDACLEGEAPWLAYEFVEGGDLTAVARDLAKLAPEVRAKHVIRIMQDLGVVVGHFHRLPQPVVHRDLKPANVLVRKLEDRWLLRVTDFGISHIVADRSLASAAVSTPTLTLGQTFRGAHTPIYSSPQQKRGLKADVRDDVYALGIMCFQLLLADLSAERPSGKWRRRLAECGLPEPLLDFLETSWDDDPQERPQDAVAFAERLAFHAAIVKPAIVVEPKKVPPIEPVATPNSSEPWADVDADYRTWLTAFGHENGPKTWVSERMLRIPRWQQGAQAGVVPAMTLMACCYEFGLGGMRQSYGEAMLWYRKAADGGDVTAMNELGTLYYNGRGVKRDYAEALIWYRKAAAAGNAISMCWLGWIHQNGHGIWKDSVEAMRWYRRAAEAGNPAAMYRIGLMYEIGNGAKRSLADAKTWYQKAEAAGHEEARTALKTLRNK